MANYVDRINAGLGVALRRQYTSPLDVSTVFKSKADFEAYVLQNTAYNNSSYNAEENAFLNQINPYSYPGQIVGVLDEVAGTATAYIINKVGPLGEGGDTLAARYSQVGSAVKVDGKTIALVNGVLKIANVPGEITKVMQPQLQLDGSILWVEVSETTVEGLQSLIQGLTQRVDALEPKVTAVENKITAIESAYLKSVAYAPETGIFTFTKQNGETEQIDLAIEKVVTNFEYDEEEQALVLTLADGTTQKVPLTAFIDDYTAAADATQVQLAISGTNEISATLVDGGVTEAKLEAGLAAKVNAGNQAATDLTDVKSRLGTAEGEIDTLQTDVDAVELAVAGKIGAADLAGIVDGTTVKYEENKLKVGTIAGSQVSGAVAQATNATTAGKVGQALKIGSKNYDGSAAVEILAEDIGAVTADEVGELTVQAGGETVGTSAGGAKQTVNIVASGDNVHITGDAEGHTITIAVDEQEVVDTNRAIKVNGAEMLTAADKKALDFVANGAVSLTPDAVGGTLTVDVKNGSINATKIAANAIENSHIADSAVSTAKLAANSVTNDKIVGMNITKLTQETEDYLIIDCGNAN